MLTLGKNFKQSDLVTRNQCHLYREKRGAIQQSCNLHVKKVQFLFVLVSPPIKSSFDSTLIIKRSLSICPRYINCRKLPTAIGNWCFSKVWCFEFYSFLKFFYSTLENKTKISSEIPFRNTKKRIQ